MFLWGVLGPSGHGQFCETDGVLRIDCTQREGTELNGDVLMSKWSSQTWTISRLEQKKVAGKKAGGQTLKKQASEESSILKGSTNNRVREKRA